MRWLTDFISFLWRIGTSYESSSIPAPQNVQTAPPIAVVAPTVATTTLPAISLSIKSMEPITYLFDTPHNAYHSVRVLCDNAGLSYAEKNLICECIYQESRFNQHAVCENKDSTGAVWSKDISICQVNTYFHIGEGKDFPSVEYVLANQDKVVMWMIKMYRQGMLKQWVSYSSGAYAQWGQPGSPMWKLAA